ncbi:MAG: DUF1641 domain-containing protein [Calditrichaeota bacterium]|nr:MAG: DUF1641 domain-containing protein [Calditrichota bacterium]
MKAEQLETRLQNMETQLAEIRQLLESQAQRQEALSELGEEVSRISREALPGLTRELESLSEDFDSRDLVELGRQLLQNLRHLNGLLGQLDALADLGTDLSPVLRQAVQQLTDTLEQLEKKGYFDFLREALAIVDTIVTSFSAEDVRLLRENITYILLTIKNMTQPEMLSTLNNVLNFYRRMDIEIAQEVSYRQLFHELRQPQTRRGLAFLLEFLKRMVSPNGNAVPGKIVDLSEIEKTGGSSHAS